MATDLATLAQLKLYLQLPAAVGPSDPILQQLLDGYSAAVQNWLSRDIVSTVYTEALDGPNGQRLIVSQGPVTAVASLTILDDNGGTTTVNTADLRFGSYFVDWTKGWFPRSLRNINITYTAGYATVPIDIAEAVCEMVGLRFKELDRIGFNSKSLANETVSFNVKDMPASTRMILNQYRRVHFAT